MARFDERMLNGMGVFAAIVQARSFAAAGDLLDMSPSACCTDRAEKQDISFSPGIVLASQLRENNKTLMMLRIKRR